jgi:flagellar assembly protein FliH
LYRLKVVKRELQYDLPPKARPAARPKGGERQPSAAGAEAAGSLLDDARHEAEDLHTAAEREAQELLSGARAEAEGIKAKAERAGYAEGLARGEAEGRDRVETAAAGHIAELIALVECLRREREAALEREERDLIFIALEAANKIMRQQCRVDAGAVSRMLEEALAESEGPLKLYLSEFQNSLEFRLDKNIAKKIRRFAKGLKTVMVSEPDIIMVETETGIVDMGIATQLESLKGSLTEGL